MFCLQEDFGEAVHERGEPEEPLEESHQHDQSDYRCVDNLD